MSCADHETIRSLVRQINDAWIKGRVLDLNGFFHEQMVIAAPDMVCRGEGREACVQSYAGFLQSVDDVDCRISDIHADIWGNSAVATSRYLISWTLEGTPHQETGHEILMFQRENDTWLVIWRTLIPSSKNAPG